MCTYYKVLSKTPIQWLVYCSRCRTCRFLPGCRSPVLCFLSPASLPSLSPLDFIGLGPHFLSLSLITGESVYLFSSSCVSSASPRAAEWIHKVLIYAPSAGCTFKCRYKNRRETQSDFLLAFAPPHFPSPLFVSFLCVTCSSSDHCSHTWRRGELRQGDRQKLMDEFLGHISWQSVCLTLFICSVWLWLDVCLCVIALALSNGGSLLTKLLSKRKTNWSRNQPADLGAEGENRV